MSGTLFFPPISTAFDGTGLSVAGAELYSYETETTTPASLYLDAGLTTPAANPVVADSSGRFTPLYMDPETTYKITLRGAPLDEVTPGDILWEADPYIDGGGRGGFLAALAELATDTGETTRQITDGSIWNLTASDGYTSDDADDVTTVLRADGRLWERVIENDTINLHWWPFVYTTEAGDNSLNHTYFNAAVAFASARFNSTGRYQTLIAQGRQFTVEGPLYILPGVTIDWASFHNQAITVDWDMPMAEFTPTVSQTVFNCSFGTDLVDVDHIRFAQFETDSDGVEVMTLLNDDSFSVSATATTLTLTLNVGVTQTGVCLIWCGANGAAININSQLNKWIGGPLLERGVGRSDGIAIMSTAVNGTRDYGDNIEVGAQITGYETDSWTFGRVFDGLFRTATFEGASQAQGIRDLVSTYGQVFNCKHAVMVLAGVRTARIEHENQLSAATALRGLVLTGSSGAECTNVSAFGQTCLSIHANHTFSLRANFNRIDAIEASDTASNMRVDTATPPPAADVKFFAAGDSSINTGAIRRVNQDVVFERPDTDVHRLQLTRSGTLRASIGFEVASPNHDLYINTLGEKLQIVATGGVVISGAGSQGLIFNTNAFFAFADNVLDLGAASIAFADIYTTNAVTVTSDELTKANMQVLTGGNDFYDRFKLAANKINWYRFKIKDRGNGDPGQRWHYGQGARELWALLEECGIDPLETGFIVRSPWMEHKPVLNEDGSPVVDERGNPTFTEIRRIMDGKPLDKYAIRYTELHNALAAVTEQRLQSLEARIAALEA